MKKRWTNYEEELLKGQYYSGSREMLMELFPYRSWASITLYASKIGLSRDYKRNSDTAAFFSDTREKWYWFGFLCADGHFTNKGRVVVGLARKDHEHLCKLAKFVNTSLPTKCTTPNGYPQSRLSFQDRKFIPLIDKYRLLKKSENPPSLPIDELSDTNFLAFLIGFIDGDGTIQRQYKRNDYRIGIVSHGSWLPILIRMEKRLRAIFDSNPERVNTKLDHAGYARFMFATRSLMSNLKKSTIGLPVLKRKWDKLADY